MSVPAPREQLAALVRQEQVPLGTCCALAAGLLAEASGRPSAGDEEEVCRAALDRLAASVPEGGADDARLRTALAAFRGEDADYDDLRASLLPDVLHRRQGLPILLSVVWLEVAERVGIPAHGIGLPGHFVVGVGAPGTTVTVVDPYRGGRPLGATDLARVARLGGGRLDDTALRPWPSVDILQRVLRNVIAWAERRAAPQVEREALELALLLPRHSLDLRRRHAQLLLGLGRFAEGARELDDYADVVETVDATTAARARQEAARARARLN